MSKKWIMSQYGILVNTDLITAIYIKKEDDTFNVLCRHVSTGLEDLDETCMYSFSSYAKAFEKLCELVEELQKND